MSKKYIIKEPDKIETGSGGMVRSTSDNKTDYSLIADGPMFARWAAHLTKGAVIYGKRNWLKAVGEPIQSSRDKTIERYKESAFRHFMQWYWGETTEDHAAALFFNVNGYEAMMD